MRYFQKRSESLKHRPTLSLLFSRGHRVASGPVSLRFICCPLPEPTPIQVVFVVPKRQVRSAVHRNRIKRIMREAYRARKQPLFDILAQRQSQYALALQYRGSWPPDSERLRNSVRVTLEQMAYALESHQ